jgi:hypothetical protein
MVSPPTPQRNASRGQSEGPRQGGEVPKCAARGIIKRPGLSGSGLKEDGHGHSTRHPPQSGGRCGAWPVNSQAVGTQQPVRACHDSTPRILQALAKWDSNPCSAPPRRPKVVVAPATLLHRTSQNSYFLGNSVNKDKKRKGRSPGTPAPPTATVSACWRVAVPLLEMSASGERGVGDYRCATSTLP